MCWDLSNTLSAIGILASAASIYVAWYIYSGWTKQKQKELAANCAEILIEKIETLKQGIIKAHNEKNADKSLIDDMETTKDDIKYYQSKLIKLSENISKNSDDLAHKNLVYEQYIDSLSTLIKTLEANPKSISKKETAGHFLSHTRNLFCQLGDISLYIWK